MNVILPNCRDHLTDKDIDFVKSVLGLGKKEQEFLTEMLADAKSRDMILDDRKLIDAIHDNPHCLKISCYLYFYLLVRDELMRFKLDDRDVADYVAELLAEFSMAARMNRAIPSQTSASDYVSDMLIELQECDTSERFRMRAHIGNYALFMTGLYPERIRHRRQFKGAPGLDYYEGMGSMSFGLASKLHLAEEFEVSRIFMKLSKWFRKVRLALNDMAARYLFLSSTRNMILDLDGAQV